MRSHQLRTIATAVISGIGFLGLTGPVPAAQPVQQTASPSETPPPGRAMTAKELRVLYAGKTWLWADGGGYLEKGGRFYAAVGRDRETGSYARGTWLSTGNGRMCFDGIWTTAAKRKSARTCFVHRKSGDTIYQKKEPAGRWYVFRSSPSLDGDEFNKLVDGDRVSEQLKQLQTTFAGK